MSGRWGERLRQWVCWRFVLFFEGITLGDLWRLLRRERFAVSPRHWHRLAFQTAVSSITSVNAALEQRAFARVADTIEIPPPLFILGHYRSGTTHLHNLLALDPRFAFPNTFQVFNPLIFLRMERWMAPLAQTVLAERRPQDNVGIHVEFPNEDELAMCSLTRLSPYFGWVFPRNARHYERFLTFEHATADEVAEWKAALLLFCRKLTHVYQRPLILKSPPHTARIRLLLELFPDARFVHIHRDPYAVFQSTLHLMEIVRPLFELHRCPVDNTESVLSVYREMYDAFFAQRSLIPSGRFCETGYAELTRDSVGTLRGIYDTLGLGGFESLQPRLENYLASIASYRPNRHAELSEPLRRRIADTWHRSFEAWGYPTS